ncbi:MAG: hypothetical protein AAGA68_23075 [Pseudomonadota bacterium]
MASATMTCLGVMGLVQERQPEGQGFHTWQAVLPDVRRGVGDSRRLRRSISPHLAGVAIEASNIIPEGTTRTPDHRNVGGSPFPQSKRFDIFLFDRELLTVEGITDPVLESSLTPFKSTSTLSSEEVHRDRSHSFPLQHDMRWLPSLRDLHANDPDVGVFDRARVLDGAFPRAPTDKRAHRWAVATVPITRGQLRVHNVEGSKFEFIDDKQAIVWHQDVYKSLRWSFEADAPKLRFRRAADDEGTVIALTGASINMMLLNWDKDDVLAPATRQFESEWNALVSRGPYRSRPQTLEHRTHITDYDFAAAYFLGRDLPNRHVVVPRRRSGLEGVSTRTSTCKSPRLTDGG